MTDASDLTDYQARARAWLEENFERRDIAAPEVALGALDDPQSYLADQRARQRRLCGGGYAGITWPTQYGGQGLSRAHERAFLDEAVNFVLPDFGVLASTTFGSCVPTMLAHAEPDFLATHVPAVLAGDELWCQFFSEPGAGSDLAAVQTRADRDGDGWVLTGAKIWSSGAHLADWGMCLARTDWSQPKHRGLTWFAVPTNAPGLTIRQIKQINGSREFCEEFFDGVRVSDTNRIGEVNAGWTVTGTMLVFERGANRPGAPENVDDPGEIDAGLLAVAERSGRQDDPLVIDALVRAHCEDYVVRQVKARIETMATLDKVSPGVASYGKLIRSQQAASQARIGMEIGGELTVAWDRGTDDACTAAAATAFMGSKALAIAGGTEQMQRNGISERVLGLPREPAADLNVGFAEMLRRQRAARKPG